MTNQAGSSNKLTIIAFIALFLLPAMAAMWIKHTGAWENSVRTVHGELMNPLASFDWHAATPADIQSTAPNIDGFYTANADTNIRPNIDTPENIQRQYDERRWKMIFSIPPVCSDQCQATIYQINQVHEATAKDGMRLQKWLVMTPRSDPSAINLAQSLNSDFVVWHTQSPAIQSDVRIQDYTHHWYIADPMDTVMMRFDTPKDNEHAISEGRGALKDIKRLLKVSKIG